MLKKVPMLKKLYVAIVGLALVSVLSALDVNAQKKGIARVKGIVVEAAPEANSYDLDQCRNGAVEDGSNPDCIVTGGGDSGWVNGNAGDSNAHWAEYQFIAYRLRLSGLATGSHTLVLEYDVRENGKWAIDYLGGYNVTETDADACSGVAGCAGAGNPFLIPADPIITAQTNPNTGLPVEVAPDAQRQMLIWGGTITSIVYNGTFDPLASTQPRSITVTFNADVPNPVIAWGGHIAWRGDWGVGNSAAGINGSSYHMRVLSLDGSGGNQDRSLQASAVDLAGGIVIRKVVETPDDTDMSTQEFTFNATAFFPPDNQFVLVDNVAGSAGVGNVSAPMFDNGQIQTVFVTEQPTTSWNLINVDCDDLDSTQDSVPANGTATINVSGTEIVTCTFTNGLTIPSAADASISGRVVDYYGRGISGATISVVNFSTGEVKGAFTNSYGYYEVKDLQVGDFFSLAIRHRRYTFVDPVRTFSLEADLTNADFTANR